MNEQAIYKEQKLNAGHILQIFQDTWAESPRSWDNLGTMAIFHKKYNFGDEASFSSEDFDNWAKMEEYINTKLKAAVCIPIYMYDHGGITINTQGFTDPWDSGQIGFIYVTEDKLKDIFGEVTEVVIKKATEILEQEVKTMDTYLTGNVYGFQLIKREPGKEDQIIDSCSGFYGEDTASNGMLENIPKDLIAKL
jgi:hypothetical protein